MRYKLFPTTVLWLVLALAAFGFTGCSVFMAAKGPGKKDLKVLKPGSSRYRVLSELGQPVASERRDDRRVDIFSFTQGYSKGSKAGRALWHGTADVFTLGLWEIIGTPTETVLDGKKMAFEVHYDANDRVAKVVNLRKTKKPRTTPTHIAASGEKSIASKSPPTKTGVRPLAPAAQGALIDTSYHQNWAVIVGISKYQYVGANGLTNLIFADDDARVFARVLMQMGWSQSHIKLLVNERATKRNITIALESWLTKAGPNSRLVLFWAGHAFPDPEDPEKIYFACYDTDISIPATGYRMDRVRSALEEQNTKNVLLFADTCHAGKLITRGERGIGILPGIDRLAREKKIPKGWIFMVGADVDRKAIEHTSWTNGAFTHSLIKGLKGDADGYQSVGRKDNIVTMGELRAYMNSAMPEETQRVLGVAKRPVITTSTGDPDIWNLTLRIK
ncbi:MAG: hypothetical protein ACYS0I_10920 [Planctomycetota bacterium]|jgi:hypothetical protein